MLITPAHPPDTYHTTTPKSNPQKTTKTTKQVPSITVEASALRASKALLRRVSSLTLHSGLMDSNLYLLAHWVLELIEHKGDFTRWVWACVMGFWKWVGRGCEWMN